MVDLCFLGFFGNKMLVLTRIPTCPGAFVVPSEPAKNTRSPGFCCPGGTQIVGLVAQADGGLAGMSASNWSSLGDPQALARLEADPEHRARFLDNETWACRQPGCLNGGTHLIIAARYQRKKK
jgi:hypothetical protein